MKLIKTSLAVFLLMTMSANAIQYKSDDFDELLEGVITNNHKDGKPVEKPKGQVDLMVEEALAQAKDEEKSTIQTKKETFKPLSQEEQWKKLISEPDPLQDQDIYAGERQKQEEAAPTQSAEDTEMEDDLSDLLSKSFDKEKKKSTFVNNIPQILVEKQQENFNQMFTGISEKDINSMEI